jgi:FkbM family methyltransferase
VGTEEIAAQRTHFKGRSEWPARLRLMWWLGRQAWMTMGNDRALRRLYHPDAQKHFLFEMDFFGQRYRGDLAQYLDWCIFCYGACPHSELRVLKAVTETLRAERTGPVSFFDVGANVGHHSLFMAGVADKVFSFEPFEKVRSQFETNIALNGLKNIEVLPIGLGAEDEVLAFYPGEGANDGVGTFLESSATQHAVKYDLPVRRGDALFAERSFPKIDIMKVDVEGFEAAVFAGLRERIRRDRPVILTELSPSSHAEFHGEEAFRHSFYEGAVLAEVEGRLNQTEFKLRRFGFKPGCEILVVPPEMADFIQSRIAANR